jgi:hypothetical protein
MEDSFLPPSFARTTRQCSGAPSYRSDIVGSSKGNTVFGGKIKPRKLGNRQEGFGEGYRDTVQLSPLPPAAKGDGGRDIFVGEFDFSLPPKRGEFDWDSWEVEGFGIVSLTVNERIGNTVSHNEG